MFTGVNVENASYPLGMCAERAAVAAAVVAGESSVDAVAVVGPGAPIVPCGGCLQVLSEFGREVLVFSEGVDGSRTEHRLIELLTRPFPPPPR